MSVTLVSYPSNASRYYAVNNPLLYKFQATGRGGGAYGNFNYLGTFVTQNVAVVFGVYNKRNDVRAGDVIKIQTNVWTIITTVSSVVFNSAGNTEIYLVANVPSTQQSPIITSINDYRVECRVFHGRKEQEQGGSLVMRQVGNVISIPPDSAGVVELYVNTFLKSFVDLSNTINLQKKNTSDDGVWGRFYVQYREKWDNDGKAIEDGWTPSSPGSSVMRWWVSAVKQIKSEGDVSMFPKVTPPDDPSMGKFLTSFEKPEYYVGYPNEISFIWKNEADWKALESKEVKLNQSQEVTATVETDLLTEGYQAVNRLSLTDASTAAFLVVSIETDLAAPEQYVNVGYVQANYFEIQ